MTGLPLQQSLFLWRMSYHRIDEKLLIYCSELVSLQRPEGLKLIVSDDGALYLDKVMALCAPPPLPASHSSSAGPSSSLWKELVILIPLRLGLDNMNPVYYTPILELFKFPQSLGIVGGKPRASLYFIAAQGMGSIKKCSGNSYF